MKLKGFHIFFLSGLLLGFVVAPVWAVSNFVRVPLGYGASIEIPKNWEVLSNSQRITIDAFVEAKGFKQTESTFGFASNLYDDRGKILALVNARFYPDNQLTQADASGATPADIREIDMVLKKSIEQSLKAIGIRLINWYGSKMKVINGLYVIVHEHQHFGSGGMGITRSRGLRVWRSPHSFTVTLQYLKSDATTLQPIIDYMTNSLRQE